MEEEKTTSNQNILHSVYVVYGNDLMMKDAMYTFLKSLKLEPVTKQSAVNLTGDASPFAYQVIDAAFKNAQAIVVLFTGDERVRLRKELRKRHEKTFQYQPQPGQDQIFEAGYAFGYSPERTILIQAGRVQLFSDIEGRYIPNFTGTESERRDLINRLKSTGCIVNDTTDAWRSAGDFSDHRGKSTK